MRRSIANVWSFVLENSLLLIIGAVIALLWANTNPGFYHSIQEAVIYEGGFMGHIHVDEAGHVTRTLTLHYLVNDVLMALFFAIAGKEVFEAIALKPRKNADGTPSKVGSLRGTTAFTPLFATLGGVIGPIAVYLCLAMILGSTTFDALHNGWAIPTATDIAFSYFVGCIIFGKDHPAVNFLLLLAIVDDAVGLLILAIFYPSAEQQPVWLLLSIGVALLVFLGFNWLPRQIDKVQGEKKYFTWIRKKLSVWPYVIAGCISWYAFQESGIHPALGLLPIIPAIPHADHDEGIFAFKEGRLHDLLNTLEHALKIPVQIILMLFALMNAGVVLTIPGEATWLVLAGLLLGKPVGIFIFGYIAVRFFKWNLSKGMRLQDLFVLGCVAAVGFTVALFVASVAFDSGDIQDGAKMGALLSILAVVPAMVFSKVLRVKKVQSRSSLETLEELPA